MLAYWKILVLFAIQFVAGEGSTDQCEDSIFCYGRLLHDVQVHGLFENPRDFLELRALRLPKVISVKYRDIRPKLKLSQETGRQDLKNFIRQHFVNRTCYERAVPPDWSVQLPFVRQITHPPTLEFLRVLNKKWAQSYYNTTADAEQNQMLHSTLLLRHAFYGSTWVFDYEESWWLFQGLLSSGMLTSARQLIENLAGLIDDHAHVPKENRVYFLERTAPPFLAIMLESYYNLTGNVDFARYILPYAELDFHYWIHSTTEKALSAFDVYFIVNDPDSYVKKPRPERYSEDWNREPKVGAMEGITVASIVWESDPPRGTQSVRLTAITEWAARVLARLCSTITNINRRLVYSVISGELLHTMDTLLYNKKNEQWMDYSPLFGHVNNVSLWPVYTGARPWKSHYKVPPTSSPEDALVAAIVLNEAKLHDSARDLATSTLTEFAKRETLSLKASSVAIVLICQFPKSQVRLRDSSTTVHRRITLIAIPMLIVTIASIPFLFTKLNISR